MIHYIIFRIFHSHFAYDDGTAELAYGINISGARLAYQFKYIYIFKSDTDVLSSDVRYSK